jgi:hypothetical protein
MVPIEVRQMTEKQCWEGLDLNFRKNVGVWT